MKKYSMLSVLVAVVSGGPVWAACSDTTVEFRDPGSETARARFTVEIADEWPEIQKGLMNRESMPKSAGMLFVYDAPRVVNFWMKNTLIPLDMVFMTEDGVVRKVHENAIPLDETSIPGGNAIKYVLVALIFAAGMLGITEGSEMRHPAVDPDRAAWPCD